MCIFLRVSICHSKTMSINSITIMSFSFISCFNKSSFFLGKGRVWSIKLSALPRVVVFATDLNPFFIFIFGRVITTDDNNCFWPYLQVHNGSFFWIFFNYHLLLIHCLAILVLSMIRKYWTMVSNTERNFFAFSLLKLIIKIQYRISGSKIGPSLWNVL